jgi:2-keto-4-pentenoate hydratase/2-oxohepta-3-ene-1,7-dioic acid hydratase in catechol pathway
MRIARILTPAGASYAVARADDWAVIVDPFAAEFEYTGATVPLAEATLLAPVEPAVIVGIAHNLTNNDHPMPMQAWLKSNRTLANPGDSIRLTRDVGTVNVEGELCVVIGKYASKLTLENAFEVVLGYTAANDVTNVDQVPIDSKNFQPKAGVNYTPVGPWIETTVGDPENVATTVRVNGEVRAVSGSFNLPSSVAQCLVYVTQWLELGPGDIVLTGAPNTFVAVNPGDTVEITLDGIGTLANPIS